MRHLHDKKIYVFKITLKQIIDNNCMVCMRENTKYISPPPPSLL